MVPHSTAKGTLGLGTGTKKATYPDTADIQLSSRATTWYVKLWSICDIFVTFSSRSSFSLFTASVTEHRKLAVVESVPSIVPIEVQQILALQLATLPCKPNQTQ